MSPPRGADAREGARIGLRAAAALVLAALAGCGVQARPTPTLHRVTIHGFLYAPATFTATEGDTVEWRNLDIVPHTATAMSHAWDTGSIAPDSSARVVLGTAGGFDYVCAFHTNMKAHVEVVRR